MKRKLAVAAVLVLLAAGEVGAQKLKHRVVTRQLNEWQALVSCRNGRTPAVSKEVAGSLIVSCEGREQGDE